ncbi:uncharacterized protein B0H18DRAFT_1112305 [Fomitopsis serialis]|uniref:uncharacterized protein n=1 Tax=Fomitopsis serialis TaxID=139415 RepID=UPI0020080EA2|nr:uncharacterized protein B0H18DRAFT_1112305 [Neoantrodia serialis]KAH9938118.1 hypothetical protein B0H18DRAFT_1112305 [Neoantrodia serialis]
MTDPYVDRSEAYKSYRPVNNLMSPGLKRAREPFRVRNAVVGTALVAFATGVWAYSISAVKQDVFDDVDEEARALARARERSLEEQEAERKLTEAVASSSNVTAAKAPAAGITSPVANAVSAAAAGRGILPPIAERYFPRLLDPSTRTLVWGAPSVDSIGKLSDRSRH